MSKKLYTKFIDMITDHVCNEITENCKYFLNEWGIQPEYITDENIKYWCKGFSNKNFDTLVEECSNSLEFSFRKIMAECIVKECEFVKKGEGDWYTVNDFSFNSFYYFDKNYFYFSYNEITKLEKIMSEDEDYFSVNEIYDKCMSKIGNVVTLTDIIILLTC